MRHLLKLLAIFLCTFSLHLPAWAASEHGSAAEAIALVKKATEFLKANGKEKAYAEFSNPNGAFKDRDLYIFVFDMNGVALAHGANPKLIGKSLIGLKDVDGVELVKSFINIGNTKGSGWTDYKWPHPVSKAIEAKSSYVEKHDDVLIGCGVYK